MQPREHQQMTATLHGVPTQTQGVQRQLPTRQCAWAALAAGLPRGCWATNVQPVHDADGVVLCAGQQQERGPAQHRQCTQRVSTPLSAACSMTRTVTCLLLAAQLHARQAECIRCAALQPHTPPLAPFLAGRPRLRFVMGMGAIALSVSLLKYFWLRLRARALRPAALPLLAASAACTAAITSSRTFCTAALYRDCCSGVMLTCAGSSSKQPRHTSQRQTAASTREALSCRPCMHSVFNSATACAAASLQQAPIPFFKEPCPLLSHLVQLVVLCDHLLSQLTLEAAQHKGSQQRPHALDQLLLNLRVGASTQEQVICRTRQPKVLLSTLTAHKWHTCCSRPQQAVQTEPGIQVRPAPRHKALPTNRFARPHPAFCTTQNHSTEPVRQQRRNSPKFWSSFSCESLNRPGSRKDSRLCSSTRSFCSGVPVNMTRPRHPAQHTAHATAQHAGSVTTEMTQGGSQQLLSTITPDENRKPDSACAPAAAHRPRQ